MVFIHYITLLRSIGIPFHVAGSTTEKVWVCIAAGNVSEIQNEPWGTNRRANGSLFHKEGPTIESARLCLVDVRAKETRSTSVPLSGWSGDGVPEVGQQRSACRPEQGPTDTYRPGQQIASNPEYDPLLEGWPVEYI